MDDEISFAEASVAMSRARSVSARSSVSFGPAGATSVTAAKRKPRGILKPTAGMTNTVRPGGTLISRTKKELYYSGGAIGWYQIDRWIDQNTRKRISIQLHVISTDDPHGITMRVSTNQREFIFGHILSLFLTNQDNTILYLFEKCQKSVDFRFLNTKAKFLTYMRNHPRVVARAQSIKKLTGGDPTLGGVVGRELRIPLGMKADFDLVSQEEDQLFYGSDVICNPQGESFIFVELQQQRECGYRSPKPSMRPAGAVQTMGRIPEEVSIRSDNDRPISSDELSRMEVETVYMDSDDSDIEEDDANANAEEEWLNHLRAAEITLMEEMENASDCGNIEVETVYTVETESSRRPPDAKKARTSPSSLSAASFKSAKSSKSANSGRSVATAKSARSVGTAKSARSVGTAKSARSGATAKSARSVATAKSARSVGSTRTSRTAASTVTKASVPNTTGTRTSKRKNAGKKSAPAGLKTTGLYDEDGCSL